MARCRGTIGNHLTVREFHPLPTWRHKHHDAFSAQALYQDKAVRFTPKTVIDQNPPIHTIPSKPLFFFFPSFTSLLLDLCRDQTREPLKMCRGFRRKVSDCWFKYRLRQGGGKCPILCNAVYFASVGRSVQRAPPSSLTQNFAHLFIVQWSRAAHVVTKHGCEYRIVKARKNTQR